jgi:cell shape-determining protein MreC
VAIVSEVTVIEDQAFMRILAAPIAKLDRSNHVLLLSRQTAAPTEPDSDGL